MDSATASSTAENAFAGTASSLEQFRLAAAEHYRVTSIYAIREAGWLIVELKVEEGEGPKFAYTNAHVTAAGDGIGGIVSLDCVKTRSQVKPEVEAWHTHFDGNLIFSGNDANFVANFKSTPLFLINS